MIDANPSRRKNKIRITVSDTAPLSGHRSSTTPAVIATIAETNDQTNPAERRLDSVVTPPMMPLSSKSQPTNISKASVAIVGKAIAVMPRSTNATPSTTKSQRCELNGLSAR